jgi:flagellin-like hook-associated protein FlgL
MSAGTDETFERLVEREARDHDIDIAAVRRVDTGDLGPVYRVLETDADAEKDQVGFQIEYPTTAPNPETMVRSQLKKYLTALAGTARDETEPGYTVNEQSSDATDSVPETPTSTDVSATAPGATQMHIEVALTAESVQTLTDELGEVTAMQNRLDDIESRLDQLESMFNLPGDTE